MLVTWHGGEKRDAAWTDRVPERFDAGPKRMTRRRILAIALTS